MDEMDNLGSPMLLSEGENGEGSSLIGKAQSSTWRGSIYFRTGELGYPPISKGLMEV